MIICSCNVLTDGQVLAAVEAHGALRTTQVHCSLGCRPRCGRCFSAIRAILEGNADGKAARMPRSIPRKDG